MGVFGRLRNSVYRLRQHVFLTNMVAYPFNFAMLSHAGRVRKGNEDTCAASIAGGAFVVCDGMGGAAGGEIASSLAAETFLNILEPRSDKVMRSSVPRARLDAAIHAANQAVYQQSRARTELRGMGTTLVALLLTFSEAENGRPTRSALTLAHVGDSRCYRFRAGVLEQLTADHSLVEEQVRAGELTAYEATQHPWRNIITRAVGSQPTVEPEIQTLDALPGDLYLLASDGLTRDLTDEEIAGTIRRAYEREQARQAAPQRSAGSAAASSHGTAGSSGSGRKSASAPVELARITENIRGFDLAALCQSLIDQANDAGGGDNITVLLLAIK